MWDENGREQIWQQIDTLWDIVIVGGGITGAGILREAARLGLRVLLVEQRDFAWGTSSRSSKLVHGGLRYLATGQLRLTWASVREREQLLEDGPGLIDPLGFLMVTRKGQRPGRWTYGAGLSLYDLMAMQWSHRYFRAPEFKMLAPYITPQGLAGGFRYDDAQTDDARLVLRVIQEAVAEGGFALNHTRAEDVICENDQVVGVVLRDMVDNTTAPVKARVVVNATGAWADQLREQIGAASRIRPLRGSHLVFPGWRLPLAQAVAFLHPVDGRPVFVFPWEGATIVGTTDVDHHNTLDAEPAISPEEVAYLMAAVTHQFPSRGLTLDDVMTTFAGVRPVIGTNKADPSKESRDHVVWEENGLLTVTGGKLTTFRVIAADTLREMHHRLPEMPEIDTDQPVMDAVDMRLLDSVDLPEEFRRRLVGRYGEKAVEVVQCAQSGELECVPGTETLWVELRWAARSEGVIHLDDLLLRRVRLGVLLEKGGEALLPRIRDICQAELGWSDDRWEREVRDYLELWHQHYALPARDLIPNWEQMLATIPDDTRDSAKWRGYIVAFVGMLLMLWVWRMRRQQ